MNLPKGFDFSQSSLQDYIDCPYRFYLRHILKAKWPALLVDEAIDFEQRSQAGARFHRLVQQYLIGIPEEYLTQTAASDSNREVITWWNDFLNYIPTHLSGKKYPETTLSTTLKEHRIIAKFDLLLISPETTSFTIFDWKTSKKLPRRSTLQDRVQTRLYLYLLTRSGYPSIPKAEIDPDLVRMIYWFANYPEKTFQIDYDLSAYENDQGYFSGLIDEILKKPTDAFIKTSDVMKCRYCIYRSRCDRGTSAGDLAGFEELDLEPDDIEPLLDFDEIEEIKF